MTLIGANGAGKTTTLRTITGLLEPRQGRVVYEGEDISGKPTHKLVARGISMSPEGRGVFANLTVRENLQMGAYLNRRQEGSRRRHGARFHDVSATQGARVAKGRNAVGRRAADAGNGTRTDVTSASAAAR